MKITRTLGAGESTNKKNDMIGKELSKVLCEIEEALWGIEAKGGVKMNYTDDGFRGATKIFMSALMDRMYDLQSSEGIDFEDRMKMAEKAGRDVRSLVKTYTNIDTHEIYKK